MKNSTLVKVLTQLDKKEISNFATYLNANHKKSNAIVVLFTHIYKYLSKPDHAKFEKEYIRRNVLKTKTQTLKRVDNVASDILRMLEDYLVAGYINGTERELLKLNFLLNTYNDKGIAQRRKKLIAQLIKKLEAKPNKNHQDFRILGEVYHLKYYRGEVDIYKAKFDDLLQSQLNYDIAHSILKLQCQCEYLSRKNILRDVDNYSPPLYGTPHTDVPVVKLYWLHCQLLRDKTLENYNTAKDYLFENLDLFGIKDAKQCVPYLINSASFMLRNNETEYSKKLFELYQFSIDNDVLLDNGRLSAVRFNNILNLACGLGKFDFAHSFFDGYAEYIDDEEKEQTKTLAKAHILFFEEKYDEAQAMLIHERYTNVGNELRRRAIVLCCMIETQDDESVVGSYINAFSGFLSSNKEALNNHLRLGISNMLSILRKILNKKYDKSIILDQVNNAKQIYMRSWLIKKLKNSKRNE